MVQSCLQYFRRYRSVQSIDHHPRARMQYKTFIQWIRTFVLSTPPAVFISYTFTPPATAGLWRETSKKPISCSCLSLWPWFLSSVTCSLSEATDVISRFISKINGINTTIDVEARINPTVPPFCANQYDHSLEIWNPC
mmetsp:Transcript_26938/g.74046  ORF Transcript_26938/g.74046 Transcript_26938/m.74046 type:complete len:138 (-) Transcript_26938:243-656(-)